MAADFTVRGDTSLDGSGMQKGLSAMTVAAGNLISGLVAKVAQGVAQAVQTAVQMGVQYNAKLEQYQVAFTTLLGDAEAASAVLEAIKADAARTPFDTATLVKANQYLISTGESAEAARATINALGDAVSATGGGSDELGRMAQNLQQIKNAGKAGAMDVKQFAMAGIDVYGLLADYTGKTTAQVQKMDVTYELLSGALRAASEEGGRFYGAMDTQSQTLNGRLSTLKDNVTQLAGALTEGLTEQLGGAVEVAIGWVDTLSAAMAENGIPGVLQAARDIVTGLVGQFLDSVPQLLECGKALLLEISNGIEASVPEFLASALPVILEFSKNLRENVGEFVDIGVELIHNLVNGLIDAIPDLLAYIPDIIINIAGLINDNAPKILACGADLIVALIAGIIGNLPQIIESIPKIIEAIVSVVTAFNWVGLGQNIIQFLADGVKSLIQVIPDLFRYFVNNAASIVGNFGWSSLGRTIITLLGNGVSSLASLLPNIAKSIIANMKDFFLRGGWDSIGKNIITGIISGIVSAAGSLADAAVHAARTALDSAKNFLGIHSPSVRAKKEIGVPFAEGIAGGVEQDSGLAVSAAKRTAMEMVRTAQAQVFTMQFKTAGLMLATANAAPTIYKQPVSEQAPPASIHNSFTFHINESLTPAELTREAEDMAVRLRWKLP